MTGKCFVTYDDGLFGDVYRRSRSEEKNKYLLLGGVHVEGVR